MPKDKDYSRVDIREEAMRPDDQTVGARYAIGVSPRLRKMKQAGKDPGLTAFPDRAAAVQAALTVYRYGGGGAGLLLFRECDDGPEGVVKWVPVAFLHRVLPELEAPAASRDQESGNSAGRA